MFFTSALAKANMTILEPLTHRPFRNFWIGMSLSTAGFWMQNITVTWLMKSWSDSDPLMVSLVQSAMFFPVMFLSLPAGIISDRMDRKYLLIFAHTIMFLTPLAIAIMAQLGIRNPVALLALTSCLAAGNAIKLPSQSALLPDLVSKDQLPAAIGLNSMAVNGGRVLGPAVSAALLPILGPVQLLVINSLTYLSFIYVLLLLKIKDVSNVSRTASSLMEDLHDLLRYTKSQKAYSSLLIRSGLYFAAWSIILAALPLLVSDASSFGIIYSNFGIGAIAGVLAMEPIRRRFGTERILNLAILSHAIFVIGLPTFSSVFSMSICMFLIGMMSFYVMSSFQISAQQALPRELRGRGLALTNVVMMGATALSSPIWGWIAQEFDASVSMRSAGLFSIAAIAATYRKRISA